MSLNISKNRETAKYSYSELSARILWGVIKIFFRLSPRPFFIWRVTLLRLFGAKIGRNVHIYSSSDIYFPWNLEVGDWSSIGENVLIYNLEKVVIGSKTTISHRAHICAGTHDYTDPVLPLKKIPIHIADQVWVCADSFIGPGVHVGEGAVVGARAVVIKDVEEWTVVAGNPAKPIKTRYLKQ